MIKSTQCQKIKSSSKAPKRVFFKKGVDGPVYVLPEITAISPVANDPDSFLRGRYYYKVHMVNLTSPLTFAFKDFGKACRSREQLIFRLMCFWGSDTVLFANGWSGWITVVSAVRSISHIFKRGCRHVFTMTVSNLSFHLDMVFTAKHFADARRSNILAVIERLWIDRSRVHQIGMAN